MSDNLQSLKIKIISGSTRQGRFSERPAQWITDEAGKLEGLEAELLDLRDYQLPFFDEPMSPSQKTDRQYDDPAVQKWSDKINEADAFIIIAPEYNHGYPAVLKNALDWVYQEWNRKPVGFVSYGSAMGARSVEQLRQVAVELQMAPIRPAIHLPVDIFMAGLTGSGPAGPELFEPMGDSVSRFLDDLLWWSKALKSAREA